MAARVLLNWPSSQESVSAALGSGRARFRSVGLASLADRRSVRSTQRRTLDPQQMQQAVALRHQKGLGQLEA